MSLDRFVNRLKRKCRDQDSEGENQAKSAKQASVSSAVTVNGGISRAGSLAWKEIRAENLDLDYVRLFTKSEADSILQDLEKSVTYNTGQLARVMMFGKWVDIPRKQTAYGEEGLTYTFSGNTVPARPWIPSLTRIRDILTSLTGVHFNFVLVNRYKDGCDYMGEHKDDEKDLSPDCPIASLSFGQPRDFYFKHQDSRGKNATRTVERVSLVLEHGGLLLMKAPTNQYWYHALPQRKRLGQVRVNLTFRKMNPAMCKPLKTEL
ncbi:DNA oxidative demethylase ALKBH2-like [Babylonia areolata]|uniref:DNA oxidative demethylase ALKBH2-like n=1 Tax=Babylonia areolata TaxID=304850 RepID=UPI003FD25615